jgi:CubicO group peptidase (beta-lactamase class C family)
MNGHVSRRASRASRVVLGMLLLMKAAAGTAARSHSPSPVVRGTTDVALTEVERSWGEQLDAADVPGGAVVVVSDGQIEARGVGSADDSPDVTASTTFVIGSTTKSFTAPAVLQLVNSGDVDLDAPAPRLAFPASTAVGRNPAESRASRRPGSRPVLHLRQARSVDMGTRSCLGLERLGAAAGGDSRAASGIPAHILAQQEGTSSHQNRKEAFACIRS